MGFPDRPPGRGELKCGWCSGTGKDRNGTSKCRVCGGRGRVMKHPDSRHCGGCRGTGEEPHLEGTPATLHSRCGGTGWIEPQ